MESMWFYVLCFFYIFIYGRYSVSSCSDFGGTSNFTGETHYIGRNLISKTKEKIPGVRRFQASETKEQKHLLLAVSIFSNVKQLIKGYIQIRKHSQGYELLKESVHMQGKIFMRLTTFGCRLN